jgi:DNA-binding protein HU-beta
MAKAPAKPAAKAAAAPKAAAAKVATITLKQIAADIAATHEMPKRQAEAILTEMIDAVVKNLKKGSRVRIAGLGILQVKKRAARMGRNPATGEAIKIKASKKVAFRPLKELKEAI